MSNKTIYVEHTAEDRTPYVYIIRHIESGKIYVGVKFAIGCRPDTFFVDYFTSQNIVKQMLLDEGIECFIIERIYIFSQKQRAIDFETRYLKRIKAKSNPKVLNQNENNQPPPYGQEEFIKLLQAKYGVKNCQKLDWVKKKKEQTQLKNYGVTHPWKQKIVYAEHVSLMRERHGVYNCQQLDWVKKKKEQTQLKNYGVEYYIQSTEGQEHHRSIMMERHGVTNASYMEQVKEKKREKALEDYGVDNVFKQEIIKQKIIETNLAKYGVTNFSQIEKEKIRASKNLSDQLNASRDLIEKIKAIVLKHKLKLGRGWHLKSRHYIEELCNRLTDEYSL